jgi:methyl-accepting chemotaxis protein
MSFVVPRRLNVTIGVKIYALIAMTFMGLIAVTVLESGELAARLKQQKQIELKHLTEVGLDVVKEEYAASQKGEVSVADAQKRALARLAVLRYGNGDYFWVNDMQPNMLMHPTKPELNGKDLSTMKDPNGKLLFVEFVEAVRKNGAGLVSYEWPKPGFDKPQPKQSYVVGFAPWNWVIGTGVYIDDLDAQTRSSTQRALLVGTLVLLIMLTVSVFVARSMTGPLQRMTTAMKDIAAGDVDAEVPGIGRRDELGEMAGAVEVFKRNAIARLKLEGEQKQSETRAVAQRRAEMHRMADDFEGAVGKIVDAVSSASAQLEASATTLRTTADRAGGLATAVAAASGEASGNVHAVASATEEMSASISEISRQVQALPRSPPRPSTRRAAPTTVSVNCRRPQAASATWSS